MEAHGLKLVCDENSYYAILNHTEYEPSYGSILISLSDVEPAQIKRLVMECPYFNEKITEKTGLLDVATWLHDSFAKNFDLIVAEIIFSSISSFVGEFFTNRERLLLSLNEAEDKDQEKAVKSFVLEDTPFTEYGFETVGHLLLSSLDDITWGIVIIRATLGKLADGENSLVQDVISPDIAGSVSVPCQFVYLFNKVRTIYIIESMDSILLVELSKIFEKNIQIKRCQNCGLYFIPQNRTDEIYCDRTSPQIPQKTCKQYGSDNLWYERLKQDEVAKLARNVYMAKQMLTRRNPDIEAYAKMFEYFKAERKKWGAEIKHGTKTKEEYVRWLNEIKQKKTLSCD